MDTPVTFKVNNINIQEVNTESFKEYRKRVGCRDTLAIIDKYYWRVFAVSLLLASVIPSLVSLCILYLPVATISKGIIKANYKKSYVYEKRIL